MEQRSQWNFESSAGGWVWTVTHPDGRTEACEQPFKTLKQCVDDANQRGYVAWKAEDERRRDLASRIIKPLARGASD